MATTIQGLSALEAPSPDDMDLLSDAGFDRHNDNIHQDFGASNAEDDALSLQDAGMDGMNDARSAPGDQDDYMVDKEDAIEEDDFVDYADADVEIHDAGQPSNDSSGNALFRIAEQPSFLDTSNEQPITDNINHEDDLIDYSDDEEEQPSITADTPKVDEPQPAGPSEEAEDALDYTEEAAQNWDEYQEANWEEHAGSQHDDATHKDGNDQHEDEPVAEQADAGSNHEYEHHSESGEGNGSVASRQVDQGHLQPETEAPHESKADHVPSLPPVTLSYDGTEYWLFNTSDAEEGDVFLWDESVATQPLTSFFNACRTLLGDELSNETELGLHFDNYYGLKVFEDNMACACLTLKEFIDIYLQLHAQDGLSDPTPFYITLLLRPRLLTQVGELKKAVYDSIGFKAMNAAVDAGKTSFHNSLKKSDADFYAESEGWQEEHDDETGSQAQKGAGVEHVPQPEGENDAADSGSASHADQVDASPAAVESDATDANDRNVEAVANTMTTKHDSAPGAAEDEKEEYITYEDAEDDETTAPTEGHPVNEPSSASSTVQGDSVSYADADAEDSTNFAELDGKHTSTLDNNHGIEDHFDTQDPTLQQEAVAEYQFDEGAEAENSYDETYGVGEDLGQNFVQDENGYIFDDDGNMIFPQQEDPSLVEDAPEGTDFGTFDGELQGGDANNFEAGEDFVDFTGSAEANAPEDDISFPYASEDVVDYNDEEEDVIGEAAVAASSAVPPAVASSTGLDNLGSPQGQKRPIDEVDGGLDGADKNEGMVQPIPAETNIVLTAYTQTRNDRKCNWRSTLRLA